MNIATPGPSLLHVATSASELRARGLDLRVGRRISGVVLATSGDRAVVDLGGTVVVARTALPLREGQAFTVSVAESRADLVVLRLVADDGAEAAPAVPAEAAQRQAVAQALASAAAQASRQNLAAALRAAGLTPTPDTMEAAAALVAQGLPLTPRSIEFILRRMDAFVGPRQSVARALAVVRALDLPPTDAIVALVLSGSPGQPGPLPLSRLATLQAAAAQALEELPSPDDAVPAPQQAFEALAAELGGARDALPSENAASIARVLRALELPADTWPQAVMLAHEVDTAVRAMPTAEPDAWPQVAAGLLSALDDIEPAVRAVLAAMAGTPSRAAEPEPAENTAETPATPQTAGVVARTTPPAGAGAPSSEGLRDLASNALTHLRNLSLLIGSETAAPQAVGNILRALHNLLQPHLPQQGSTPTTLASELAQRVETLLARVDSALPMEPPRAAEDVRELLTETLSRLAQQAPGQPPDRLQVLTAVVERARELLGPPTGWEPPPVRALARELADVARMLAERAAGTQVREAVAEGLERLTDVLALAETASRMRRNDLLTLFVGRAGADIASALVRNVEELLRWWSQALARAAPTRTGSVVSAPELAPAVRETLRELLVVVGTEVRPRLEEVLGALGSPAAERSRTMPVPSAGRALDALAELIALVPPEETEPAPRPPTLDQTVADARGAAVAGSVRAVRGDLDRLVDLLARVVVRPAAPASESAEAIRTGTDAVATSTEAKLLSPDPRVRTDGDLRAALARVTQSAERAESIIRTVGAQPGQLELSARLLDVATAARAAGSVVEAQQLAHLAGARLNAPMAAYIQVPVMVGQEWRLAEFKVLRDPRRRAAELDPNDMTVALRLDTATLGLVVIVMWSHDGVLDLRFTLERPEYQRAVSHELPDLRGSLDKAGFRVAVIAAEVRRNASEAFDRIGAPGPEGATISILA